MHRPSPIHSRLFCHRLQVFVANPHKPRAIHNILYQNQQKLIEFLTNFQTDRRDDAQFNDEKEYLIRQIRDLRPLTNNSSTGGNGGQATTEGGPSASTTAAASPAPTGAST